MPQFPPGTLLLAGGVPDLRLAPVDALARAYRRALRAAGRASLGYGDVRGHPSLRAALADMLNATRGLAAGADDVLVTRGSQMAVYLVGRTLLAPGDVVAVEDLGYDAAWRALRAAGAELVPVPVDADGLRVDRLAALAQRRRVRAVYVTPHHQFPTLAVLSPARRMALLALARRHRFAVIEDDYDHEFHYRGRPVLPLASADEAGVVVYLGTLSKVFAPGLRIGYVVAPRPLLERLEAARDVIDRQGDRTLERAVAELFEDGELQRHARRMRRAYHERREALADAMRRQLGDAVTFELPAGGMAVWVSVAAGIDVDAWCAACARAGVVFFPASEYTFDGRPRPAARIGFATRTPDELRAAVAIMARCLPRRRGR
jgi:GntR family transcriptional regulator/MocR family aminotransferase